LSDFAPFLQAELSKHAWSYSDFASRSGLHVSLISRVARGHRQPTANFVKRCAEALALPLSHVMAAAGMLEAAVAVQGSAEARALEQYIQYATTPEGEAEIADRLPAKVTRVQQLPDVSGKLALLLGWVAELAVQFSQASGAKKALIGGALLYFLMPVDLVPDFIPVAGLLDDLAVVSLVLGMIVNHSEASGG
jgi:uncharacterized membrane protein YkvA (DUF1232 family)